MGKILGTGSALGFALILQNEILTAIFLILNFAAISYFILNVSRNFFSDKFLVPPSENKKIVHSRVRVSDSRNGNEPPPYPSSRNTTETVIVSPSAPDDETEPAPALDPIQIGLKINRGFVVGGTRSGKTYFCKALAAAKIRRNEIVYAIDPENFEPPPWPAGVKVIGAGDNLDEIENFFNEIEVLKRKRTFETEPTPITIFFDELADILKQRPKLTEKYLSVLRRGSKHKIYIWCLSQASSVGSTGLKGFSEYFESFQAVFKFKINPFDDSRTGTVDLRDGVKYPLSPVRWTPTTASYAFTPPPLQGVAQGVTAAAEPDPVVRQANFDFEAKREKARRLFAEGKKISRIALEVYGYDNARAIGKIKEMLI